MNFRGEKPTALVERKALPVGEESDRAVELQGGGSGKGLSMPQHDIAEGKGDIRNHCLAPTQRTRAG